MQLFDSWAGALGPARLPRVRAALSGARRCGSPATAGAPVIAFAPGAGWALEEIAAATGADVIGVDWQTDAADARRRLAGRPVALQGNLDPCWLYAPPAMIRERTHEMLAAFGGRGHIANLGHGITAGRAGGACAGVRRRGEGVARAVTRAGRSSRRGSRRWIERLHDETTAFFTAARRRRGISGRTAGTGPAAAAASPRVLTRGHHVREGRRQPLGGRGRAAAGGWRSGSGARAIGRRGAAASSPPG